MDITLNKTEIETKNIRLYFIKINNFDELLSCDLHQIIFIHDTYNEYPKVFLKNQQIKKRRTFFSRTTYLILNDSIFEPTKIFRDDFDYCGYVFYKLKIKLEDKQNDIK